jgi:Ca-activated chloride channel family protein
VTIQGEVIPVPSDPTTMSQIASTGGGHTFSARTAGELKSVYQDVGRAVGYDVERRAVTAWYLGIALALAVLSALAALLWTQRLV